MQMQLLLKASQDKHLWISNASNSLSLLCGVLHTLAGRVVWCRVGRVVWSGVEWSGVVWCAREGRGDAAIPPTRAFQGRFAVQCGLLGGLPYVRINLGLERGYLIQR